MRNNTVLMCIGASAFIILNQFGVINALVFFLLVGVIPGTNFSLPPFVMFILIILVGIAGLVYATNHKMKTTTVIRLHSLAHRAKSHLPQKRFSRI